MRFPTKSATILMLMSFAGGIYIALHDDCWSQQREPGSGTICATELAEQVPGGEASPCLGARHGAGPVSNTVPD